MKKLLLTLALTLPSLSYAQIFDLSRVACTGGAAACALFDAEIQKVENEINADLPAGDPKRLMEGMANSQAASGKGVATDYISHFDTFMVGAGLGLGADLEENKEYDSDLSGIGMMGAVQVGLNMSAIFDNSFLGLEPKRTTVVANFFTFNLDRDFDENNVKAEMISFGFSGTYKWIDGNGNRLFGWDGVRLHTGYQYSSVKFAFTSEINEEVNETSSGSTITGTITGDPKATIESSSHSIPLEISSGVNFLWVMSFYGGLGTDLNIGSAEGKGDLNAEDSVLTCTGGAACGGNPTATVRASANIDEKAEVNPFFLRGFVGLQANLPYVRIYAHANKVFGTEVYSFATGLRLAF
jgi:hypothetical protein